MVLRFDKSFGTIFNIVQAAFSIICSILIMNDPSKPVLYSFLWVLPLVYGIFTFLLIGNRPEIFKHLCFIIVSGLFFLRNSLTPLFMYLGDYRGIFAYLNADNINKSIVLMTLEMVIVMSFSRYCASRYSCFQVDHHVRFKKNSADLLLLAVLMAFCAGIIVINPSYMNDFVSLFSGANIRTTSIGSTSGGVLYTVFVILFPITYTFFCVYVMRIINAHFRSGICTVINILLIIVPFLFMNNSDAFNLICALCIALTSLHTGGISKKIFVMMISVGVLAIVCVLFFMVTELSIELSRNSMMQNISINLQAYLPGVCNFASIFNIGNEHSKLTSLFYDVYSVIPFRNTLFGLVENHSLTQIWWEVNGTNSQILPCIAQLYYYVGIFAPAIECLLVKNAFVTYQKMQKSEGVLLYNARCMCFIYFIITPVMYNCCILFSRFFITIVPMYVFSLLIEGKQKTSRVNVKNN